MNNHNMADSNVAPQQDCLACRIIGSTALGATGVYALTMSRPGAPGSPFGKRVMGGIGAGT
jgi:hypothetical protein